MYVCICVCVRVYKISKARNDMVACREVVSTLDYVRCIGYWSIESIPDFYGNDEVKFDLMICRMPTFKFTRDNLMHSYCLRTKKKTSQFDVHISI